MRVQLQPTGGNPQLASWQESYRAAPKGLMRYRNMPFRSDRSALSYHLAISHSYTGVLALCTETLAFTCRVRMLLFAERLKRRCRACARSQSS